MHQDKNINIDGVNIRYRDSGGSGMPVLMTHGIGGSLELWMPQLKTANDQIRMIAWDMPGHGLSDLGSQPYTVDKFAAFACQFIEALNLKKLVLAGNSLGGAVSTRVAALAPERVSGLLLANAASIGRETLLPFRLMTIPVLGEVMTKPSQAGIERQIKAIFMHASVATDEVRQVIARNTYKTGGEKAFLATLRSMTTLGGQNSAVVERTLSILQSIKCPVLFVHGQHDAVIPVKHSIDAQSITANSKLLLLDDCGHTPQMEKPAEFNSALQKFLLDLQK
jgi:pimeloyl-ACP methyl ester carboxylesterase